MERSTLLGGEHRSDLALDLVQRDAELVEDTLGSMAARSCSRSAKNLSSALPESPSAPSGSASTQRHRSGIGWRATTGLIVSPSRTPASTTRPGAANVQDPTLERDPRPTAAARRSGLAEIPASSATPRATASPSFVPDPRPAWGGIAS
jgi:hypothetical protein